MDTWAPKDPAEVRAMLEAAAAEMHERAARGELPETWQPSKTGPTMPLISVDEIGGGA